MSAGVARTCHDALVSIENVSKRFPLPHRWGQPKERHIVAVEKVSIAIPESCTFGLVGESGSGKSTVAKMLLKLEAPTEGTVKVEGEDVFRQSPVEERAYRRKVQTVFQDPYGALSPRMSAGEIVAEPLRAQGVSGKEALDKAGYYLSQVGLDRSAAVRFPHEFSGGQRQRIAIARALSVDPRMLVLDEPVSALDVSVRAQVLTLLRDLQRERGLTYLFIGHDLAVVQYLSDIVGVMYFGRMVEVGRAGAVLRRPRHPYTRRLAAIASGEQSLGTFRVGGELPNPLSPPSGCTFRTRCPFADERCREEIPVLAVTELGHSVACHHHEMIARGEKGETGPLADTHRLTGVR